VLAVARSAEGLARVADEVKKHGGFVETLAVDLASAAGVEAVLARAHALGDIELLVNNAGLSTPGHTAPSSTSHPSSHSRRFRIASCVGSWRGCLRRPHDVAIRVRICNAVRGRPRRAATAGAAARPRHLAAGQAWPLAGHPNIRYGM
jgi:NAD(P)-dependent dehydrogenase (short-subunit alcohol dehydrogenase family)